MTPPDQGSAVATQTSIAVEERAGRAKPATGDGRALSQSIGVLVMLALLALTGAVLAPALGVGVPSQSAFGAAAALVALSALWLLLSMFAPLRARVAYLRATGKQGAARFAQELRPFGYAIVCRSAVGGRGAKADTIAAALDNRVKLNLRALCADREVMTLQGASDITHALIQSSDVAIVDLSEGARVDWSTIKPAMDRCVFVSAWGSHQQAEAAFATLGVAGQCFFYAPDGEVQRRGQFRAAVYAALRASRG